MNPEAFSEWVEQNGGEVLAVTNPFEAARFRAGGATHVVYKGKKGFAYSSEDTKQIVKKFRRGEPTRLSQRDPKYNKSARTVAKIIERDGSKCWFCQQEFQEGETQSLEHLVSRQHGGPDHMSNYVLAHERCNRLAGSMSVAEKVRLRERLTAEAA